MSAAVQAGRPTQEAYVKAPHWLVRSSEIPALAKVVLLVIAGHIGQDEATYLKLQTIADEAGISPRSVRSQLAVLRDAGLLDWEHTKTSMGRGASRFTVDLTEKVVALHATTDDRSPGIQRMAPPATTPEVVAPIAEVVALRAGQEEEPSKKNPETAPPSPSKPKPSRRKPELPLPEGWTPDPAIKTWRIEQGISTEEVTQQMGAFVDWVAENDIRSRDWDLRWRRWLRTYLERRGSGRGRAPAPNPRGANVRTTRDPETGMRMQLT